MCCCLALRAAGSPHRNGGLQHPSSAVGRRLCRLGNGRGKASPDRRSDEGVPEMTTNETDGLGFEPQSAMQYIAGGMKEAGNGCRIAARRTRHRGKSSPPVLLRHRTFLVRVVRVRNTPLPGRLAEGTVRRHPGTRRLRNRSRQLRARRHSRDFHRARSAIRAVCEIRPDRSVRTRE